MRIPFLGGLSLSLFFLAAYSAPDANAPDQCRWQPGVPQNKRVTELHCHMPDDTWQFVLLPADFDEGTMAKARAGDKNAMTLVGSFYGAFAPEHLRDGALAIQWLRQAAAKGDTVAMFKMGVLLENGKLVPKDYAEAKRWYLMAAEAGDRSMMLSVAIRYERGVGAFGKDYEKAAYWYRRCADLGEDFCMIALSQKYRTGQGVPRDSAESDLWWQRHEAAAKTAKAGAQQ